MSVHRAAPPGVRPAAAPSPIRRRRAAVTAAALAAPLAAAVALAVTSARAAGGAPATPEAPPPAADGAGPRAPAAVAPPARVDRRLAADLAAGRSSAALAILHAQADLSGAEAIAAKTAKVRFVRQRLVAVADATQRPVVAALARRGVPFTAYHIVNAVAFEADAATVAEIALLPGVASIVPLPVFGAAEAPRPAADASAPRPAGAARLAAAERNIRAIGADKVWRRGFEGAGATVAILDTGVNARHPALATSYRGRADGDDHNWLDAVAGQSQPIDVNDHGTHVAGIAVGRQGSREIGVAPEANWIACRVFAQDRGTTKAILDCLQWSLAPTKRDGSDPRPDLAPDIINASWGTFGRAFCDNPFPAEAAIRNLVAAGILFVAAAGNDGPRCGSVCPPGSLAEAFTVGNYDDERRTIADSSSRGPFVAGGTTRIKPDVAAPGEAINSSLGSSGYGVKQGTSMAAPHVGGAAALLLSAAPGLRGRPAALRSLLEDTATKLNADACGPSGGRAFNNAAGHGVIDVEAAVAAALDLPTATPTATDAPRPTATATGVPTATARATPTPGPTTPAAATATTEWTPTPRPSVPPPTATRSTAGLPAGRLWLPVLSR